jgi:hypothetical protein
VPLLYQNLQAPLCLFKCRKSFKKAPFEDHLEQKGQLKEYRKLSSRYYGVKQSKRGKISDQLDALKNEYDRRQVKCPDCGGPMANLGLDFKAPPRNKIKKWKVIESMYKMGHSFYSCGCHGPGYIPASKSEYLDYLNERLGGYRLYYKVARSEPVPEERTKKTEYWAERIELITREINTVRKAIQW